MRVRQNVEFGLKMRGVAENERRKTVDRVLMLMGLTGLADKSPMTLSGGEKQKVALARVLAFEPRVILLDEPLSSIDEESSRATKVELKRIHHELKVTVVHVTHNQMEAFSLAERVAVMNCGQIVQVDEARSLLSSPADEFVAKFLGYENIFEGKLVKQDGRLSFVEIDGFVIRAVGNQKDDDCIVAIRPEDISLSVKPVFSSYMNVLSGSVTDYTDMGPIVTVSVDSPIRVKAAVNKGSFLELNPDRGTKVWLSFKPENVKILKKHQAAK